MVEVLMIYERQLSFHLEPEGFVSKMSVTFSTTALLQNPEERNIKSFGLC
jgi:hypothetical protein